MPAPLIPLRRPLAAPRARAAAPQAALAEVAQRPPISAVYVASTGGALTANQAWAVGGSALLTALVPTLSAAGGENVDFGATLTVPAPTLSANAGGNGSLTASAPTLAITGTLMGQGEADLVAPTALLSVSATSTAAGKANLTFGNPPTTYVLAGYSGAVLSVTTSAGTVAATGTSGVVGTVQITLPLFELVATGKTYGLSSANLLAPAPRMANAAVAWLAAPTATLVAIGSATIAAPPHEAYAVNLNHKPRPGADPVDEVTRYTNYPFDRIVRYENSYYGVAADGLYLLEGTTDYAATPTPVSWSFKTGIDDFGSAQLKTVNYVYFGGRMGGAKVTLHVGEDGQNSYTYPALVGGPRNYRQAFGRGAKARYFAITVAGSGAMELDDFEFHTSEMTRKV